MVSAVGAKVIISTATMALVCGVYSAACVCVLLPLLTGTPAVTQDVAASGSCSYLVPVPTGMWPLVGPQLLWWAHITALPLTLLLFPTKRRRSTVVPSGMMSATPAVGRVTWTT